MEKIAAAFLILIFVIGGAISVNAQSGRIIRKRAIFGTYKYWQDGQKISEKEFMAQIPVNMPSYELMQKARKQYLWGNILGFPGTFFIISQLDPTVNKIEKSPELFIGGLVLFGSGLFLILKYEMKSGLAMDLYNEDMTESKATYKTELRLSLTCSQIGLQLSF